MNRDRPLIFVKAFPPKRKAKPLFNWNTFAPIPQEKQRFDWNTFAPIPPKKEPEGIPLDISDKIISLHFEDVDDKADKLELTIDNPDLTEFDNPTWRKGGILEVSWGFVGNMGPVRRVVIEKVSGNQVMKVEAHGLEMLMHKVKVLKVYKGKTLYDLAKEVAGRYADVFKQQKSLDDQQEKAAKAAEAKFPEFYKNLAARYNLDTNAENKRHFYDYKALHADVVAGKVQLNGKQLPPQYARAAPSMWVRDTEGTLIDAKTGRAITDAEVEKVADTTTQANYAAAPFAYEDEDAGMTISPDAKKIKIAHANQSAQTDAQFLNKLARKHGFRFYYDHDKGFRFVPVGSVYKQKPAKVLTWFYGEGEWVSFSYENDSADKPKKVTQKGINPLDKKEFEQKGSNQDTQRAGLGAHTDQLEIGEKSGIVSRIKSAAKGVVKDVVKGVIKDVVKEALNLPEVAKEDVQDVEPATSGDPSHVKSKVDGKYKKRSGAAHELSGTVLGDPQFRAKTLVQVEGLGRRLSGKWEVRKVEHTVDSSGYMCSFKAQRDADNGYGEKGENTSKASQNKKEADKKDANGEKKNTDRLYIDGVTGTHRRTTGNPDGTQR